MAGAERALTEPRVLAHAKERLFPASDAGNAYAVADTQFAAETWLAGQPIDPATRETLAPFNHVRVGGGYPDLVGVRSLEADLLAVERFGDDPPLIAVEAKGVTDTGAVDTQRGILQAYDRLHEANAAFVAVPEAAVTRTDRTLARELNVGVLGVDPAGAVRPIERPRVVGNRTTDGATAIRFQAGSQGVAEKSFGLNHPKNYLGYPLALHADGPTDDLVAEHVVGAVDDARRGAAFLGLVDERPRGVVLTALGREVVRFAKARHGSVESALAGFEEWHGTTARFYDEAPGWGELARRVVFDYPATELLVTELQTLAEDGFTEPTLVDLVVYLHQVHPSFAVELFVRGDEAVRRRVLTSDGDLRERALADGSVYHSPTVFQLKAMLYHAGILAERGREPHELDPTTDSWALREVV